jgi:hypothetical protein
LHIDGYTDGSATITHLLSITGEWKTIFGYVSISPAYDSPKVEEYARKLATDLLKNKGWVTGEHKVKVLWTKFPSEGGFKVPYDSEQQEFMVCCQIGKKWMTKRSPECTNAVGRTSLTKSEINGPSNLLSQRRVERTGT